MRVRLYDSARKVMAKLALQTLAQTDGTGPALDLGCGPGLIANYLGDQQPRAIIGIDVGAKSIAGANAAARGRNRFLVYDGENIPFPDGFFEAVLCVEVLEHIDGDREILIEIARVLKPGGRLLLSTPNSGMADLDSKPHHLRHYTASELTALIEAAGLRIEAITNRYHYIGALIDRLLVRLGATVVVTEELDDEALTVSSRQPGLARLVLAVYDRLVDPIVGMIVWREYVARKRTPGASIVVRAAKPALSSLVGPGASARQWADSFRGPLRLLATGASAMRSSGSNASRRNRDGAAGS